MIDTVWIVSNLGHKRFKNKQDVKEFLGTLDSNYQWKEVFFKTVAEAHKNGSMYRYGVHITHKEASIPRKMFFIKFLPLNRFKNLSDIKIETEVTRFSNLNYFSDTLVRLFNSEHWERVIKHHYLVRCDLKFDFYDMAFRQLLDSCDCRYGRNPVVKTNLLTGRKTLQVSRNSYFYEKGELLIREEHRIYGRMNIVSGLNVRNIFDLKNIQYSHFKKKFMFKKFYDIKTVPNYKFKHEQTLMLIKFLELVSCNKILDVKRERKNHEYSISHDCFLRAKQECNIFYDKSRFSRQIVPRFKELNFNYYEQLEMAFDSYFNCSDDDL